MYLQKCIFYIIYFYKLKMLGDSMKVFKKSLYIIPFIIFIAFSFNGCNNKKDTTINTVLQIDNYYSGKRTMTCNFSPAVIPLGSDSEYQLDTIIEKSCPEGLTYKKVSNNSCISYIFTIDFNSKQEYISKVTNIINFTPTIIFSESNTIFTNGNIAYEDFDSTDILSFIQKGISNDNNLKNIQTNFKCKDTSVMFNGMLYNTSAKINFNNVEFNPITNINIETENLSNDTYNRSITITMPDSTYSKLGDSVLSYMNSRIDLNYAHEFGWSEYKNLHEFKIVYKNINLEQLKKVTSMILDSNTNEKIDYYNDSDNSSIFKKRQIFEEHIDTSSYLAENKDTVPVTYIYKSNHNIESGSIYIDNSWKPCSYNNDNTFSLTSNNLMLGIKIFEAEFWPPNSMDIDLIIEGNNSFTRNIELNYSQENVESLNYALEYLSNISNIKVSSEKSNSKVYISTSGNINELNNTIKEIFDSNNFLNYSLEENKFKALNRTNLKDNISLSQILPSNISKIPLTYTIHENSKADVSTLTYKTHNYFNSVDLDDYNSGTKDKIPLSIDISDVEIEYNADCINIHGAIFIISIATIYLIIILSIIVYINHKTKIKLSNIDSQK